MQGMEERVNGMHRVALFVLILAVIGGVSFAAGIAWSTAHADEVVESPKSDEKQRKDVRVVYPEKSELDFEGIDIRGELKNPGEFYFQHRPEEKFDSLVKRRKNFHREMLRDVVLSR